MPPESGTRPMRENDWMRLAERAANTTSHASATLAPAPAAVPLSAQRMGLGSSRMRRTSGL